ncbi:MAG: selenide, water dikinase SelD [Candidatus Kapaibacterium sp.]|nr:MAG: selenide, water dikinase SelD [Candidatus Kapabacteria bacterium]
MHTESIRLTQYSHGAGCGCKISPAVLDKILHSNEVFPSSFHAGRLLVGNNSRDDAAVYDLGTGQALISTTDFFMPIVDDPRDFGRIASANAISDVYAMGGTPIMAIAILGWTIDKLPPEIAGEVIAGSRSLCAEAGIPLAGGHSIDSPEPIFGLAVNGLVAIENIKHNNTAEAGNMLFLTKALGVGILTTAEKRGILKESDKGRAAAQMMQLNSIGADLGRIKGVRAMTDVTGFGLLGHLSEMCDGTRLRAELFFDNLPILPNVNEYIAAKSIPGGTNRNWASYGHRVAPLSDEQRAILADPQTSGGLLIAVEESAVNDVQQLLISRGLQEFTRPIGRFLVPEAANSHAIRVV